MPRTAVLAEAEEAAEQRALRPGRTPAPEVQEQQPVVQVVQAARVVQALLPGPAAVAAVQVQPLVQPAVAVAEPVRLPVQPEVREAAGLAPQQAREPAAEELVREPPVEAAAVRPVQEAETVRAPRPEPTRCPPR
jgi:hypothetical protein